MFLIWDSYYPNVIWSRQDQKNTQISFGDKIVSEVCIENWELRWDDEVRLLVCRTTRRGPWWKCPSPGPHWPSQRRARVTPGDTSAVWQWGTTPRSSYRLSTSGGRPAQTSSWWSARGTRWRSPATPPRRETLPLSAGPSRWRLEWQRVFFTKSISQSVSDVANKAVQTVLLVCKTILLCKHTTDTW